MYLLSPRTPSQFTALIQYLPAKKVPCYLDVSCYKCSYISHFYRPIGPESHEKSLMCLENASVSSPPLPVCLLRRSYPSLENANSV